MSDEIDDEVPQPRKRNPAAGHPKRFTDAEWDRMVNAFREHPGDTTRVSVITGIKRLRVVRAWHHGYERQGRPAISELLEADKFAARALRAEMHDAAAAAAAPHDAGIDDNDDAAGIVDAPTHIVTTAEPARVMAAMVERDKVRRKALEDSARTRAEEGALIAVARRNVMQLGLISAQVLRGAQHLAERMQKQLELEQVSLKDGMQLIQRSSVVVRLGNEAAKIAIQMERLAMGQPIGDGSESTDGALKPEDAERWIEVASRALERARKRRESEGQHEVSAGTDRGDAGRGDPAAPAVGTEPDDETGDDLDLGLADGVGGRDPATLN